MPRTDNYYISSLFLTVSLALLLSSLHSLSETFLKIFFLTSRQPIRFTSQANNTCSLKFSQTRYKGYAKGMLGLTLREWIKIQAVRVILQRNYFSIINYKPVVFTYNKSTCLFLVIQTLIFQWTLNYRKQINFYINTELQSSHIRLQQYQYATKQQNSCEIQNSNNGTLIYQSPHTLSLRVDSR